MEIRMYCTDCGAEVTQPTSAALTPCMGCGSTTRSSLPPHVGASVSITSTGEASLRIANGVLELGNG